MTNQPTLVVLPGGQEPAITRTLALQTLMDDGAPLWVRSHRIANTDQRFWGEDGWLVLVSKDQYDDVVAAGVFMRRTTHQDYVGDGDPKLAPRIRVQAENGRWTDMLLKNWVLGLPRGTRGVKHINGDPHDCRVSNLDASGVRLRRAHQA
jgi:hypothetical protein